MSKDDEKIPSIVLSRKARRMMRYAVMTFPNKEVQGFGKIQVDVEGDVWVTDIIIPPHEVTGSTVELKPEILAELWSEIVAAGDVPANYRLWWHSHGNMGAGHSGQDSETIRALAIEFGGVALGIVTNNREDFHGYYAAAADTDLGRFVMEGKMDVLLEQEPEDKKLKALVARMMERVTDKPLPPPTKEVGKAVGQYRFFPWYHGDPAGFDEQVYVDEQEEAYYNVIRATYPPDHETHNLTNEQFAEWYEDMVARADDTHRLPVGGK